MAGTAPGSPRSGRPRHRNVDRDATRWSITASGRPIGRRPLGGSVHGVTTSSDGAGPAGARPVFSFLTTAYRAEGTLGRTIDAVLAQTRGDWELVVVDNGNDDAVAAVAQPHLADPRIHLVRQE